MLRHSLIGQYRKLHERGKFPGDTIRHYAKDIGDLIRDSGAKSLIDYGCGFAKGYHVLRVHQSWGLMPTLYDPAVPAYAQRPSGPFDGLLAIDVLEHIPEGELSETLADISQLATMWCFLTICCRPSKNKTLLDGRNVHVTLQKPAWWLDRFAEIHGPDVHVRFTP
jgi:hypothetical protein